MVLIFVMYGIFISLFLKNVINRGTLMPVQDCESDLVLGFGKTGYSLARYLTAQGKLVDVFDTRKELPYSIDQLAGVSRVSENSVTNKRYSNILISPGLPLSHPLVKTLSASGNTISNDIVLFRRLCHQPVFAITGTNGKSSIVSMINFALLKHSVNIGIGGNIGKPVIELLDEQQRECYCLELSSFQLEVTGNSLHAEVACIANISEDHMDRYSSLKDYTYAKHNIYRQSRYTVANADDRATWPLDKRADVMFSIVSSGKQIVGLNGDWLTFNGKPLVAIDTFSVAGLHNIANIAASLAVLHLAGYQMSSMISNLKNYRSLPHRFSLIKRVDGVSYINDSKATNPSATSAALASCKRTAQSRLVLIAGGDAKGADLTILGYDIATQVDYLLLLGKDARSIAQVIDKRIPINFATSMNKAVAMAAEYCRSGDLVLLSPACSSLDMFTSFEHRGQAFIDEVNNL